MFPPLQKNLQEEGVGEPRSPNLSANLCVLYAAAIPVTVLVVVTFTKLKEWGWNGVDVVKHGLSQQAQLCCSEGMSQAMDFDEIGPTMVLPR